MPLLLVLVARAEPAFSVTRGLHETPFEVTLTPSTADATVRCSVDRSVPTTPCPDPIRITGTTVLRADEVGPDGVASPILTHTYVFVDDVVASAVMDPRITADPRYTDTLHDTLRALPWVSLVTPGALTTEEQAVSLEWLDDAAGTSLGIGAGARRVGGHSLYAYEKNSIRLLFRDDYGASRLHLDLYGDEATGVFPEDSFDALTLRGGNHDSQFYLGAAGQHVRNLWMDETQLEMGHVAPHGRFVHVLLDGGYYGLYHVRERFNAAMLADYLGGEEEDWEAINGGSAFDGSGAAWGQLVAARGTFAEARRWLNVPNFLDYMVLNYYAANAWDWSSDHNWIAVGPTSPDEGGFVFHSSDSDITFYYDPTTNILSLPGPSEVFGWLLAEGDPDFEVALRDAIFRNLEGDGPLTPDRARARYARVAALAEDGVVAESARWGLGWWDRDTYWVPERDLLLDTWIPARTDLLLDQMRAAGWYPPDVPALSPAAGPVAAGTVVTGTGAGLLVTLDGTDPRLPGGDPSPTAIGPGDLAHTLTHSTWVSARTRVGETWGPLDRRFYEVDNPTPLLLNEWNAVDPEAFLDEGGGDDALGVVPGNGGDWIELVVVEDHLDLRGWRLTATDRRRDRGTLVFTDDPLLADLRAGTLFTIAEDLPEDAAYDPDGGDWRFHLRATPDGRHVRSDGFDVTAADWQLTGWAPDGTVRLGAVGEAVAPRHGISGHEVGLLAADPVAEVRRTDDHYQDGIHSTFGAPNRWGDTTQDFEPLRGVAGTVSEVPDPDPEAPVGAGDPGDPEASACGCGTPPGRGGAGIVGLAATLLLLRRRRPVWLAGLLAACTGAASEAPAPDPEEPTDPAYTPTAEAPPEVCNGEDDDGDGQIDEDPVDGLPFWADADGDGYGDDTTQVVACAAGEGAVVTTGDCDDTDASTHPGAEEACDGVDRNCDGLAGTDAGAGAGCPATSCAAILAEAPTATDGPRWIALPSGAVTELWCDMTGGGWTLAFLHNSASAGTQGDFGAGEVGTEGLAGSPADASTDATPRLGWIDLNTFPYEALRLTGWAAGAETARSRDIPRDALRIDFGQPGYLLYGGETGYYWCGGPASYTDGGVGATDNPEGAPAGCKGHGALGSGWDFSESPGANAGLTLCGGDGHAAMTTQPGGSWIYYGVPGGAQAIWVR